MIWGLTAEESIFFNTHVLLPLKKAGAIVYVFGSRARGDYAPFSDVDILLHNNLKVNPDLDKLISEISELLEESVFPYKVEIIQSQNLAKSYLARIEKEKRVL